MKAACFSGSSLRDTAFGLRCSMKAMQQCDQARPALVCDAALPFDPGANLARRSRQGFADPGLQFVLLLVRQPAGAALVAEARQALDPCTPDDAQHSLS